MIRFASALFLALVSTTVFATDASGVVDASLGILDFTSKMMLATFGSIGFGLLVGSLFKYKSYRENPTQTPFSTVILYFIIALLMIGLCGIIVYNQQVTSPVDTTATEQFIY